MPLIAVELKRALLSLGVLSLAVTGVVLGIERILIVRGRDADTVGEGVSLFLMLCLLGLGFVAGERAFSREFKERDLPLLQTLPVPRWRLWCTIVVSHYLALLVCTAGVVALRPSILINPSVLLALVPQGFLFTASCCFALLFLRPVLTYTIGVAVTAFMLLEVPGHMLRSLVSRDVQDLTEEAFRATIEWGTLAPPLLVAAYLGCSAYCFSRGELLIFKRRGRNAGVFVVAMIAVVAFSRLIGGALWADDFTLAGYSFQRSTYVQPEGTKVFILEQPTKGLEHRRLTLIDGETGERLAGVRGTGLRALGWNADGRSFFALASRSRTLVTLDLLTDRSMDLLVLDSRGKIVDRVDLGRRRFGSVYALDETRSFVMPAISDTVNELLVLDTKEVELESISSAPRAGDERFMTWWTPEGLLVHSSGTTQAWLFGRDVTDPATIRASPQVIETRSSMVVDGLLQPKSGDAVDALLERLSRPEEIDDERAATGVYIVPILVREDTPIYYADSRLGSGSIDLFLRRPRDEGWTALARRIPTGPNYREWLQKAPEKWQSRPMFHLPVLTESLDISRTDGVLAFAEREGDRYVARLYDGIRDRNFKLAELDASEPDNLPWVHFHHIIGTPGIVVTVLDDEIRSFRYDRETGEPTRVDIPEDVFKRENGYRWGGIASLQFMGTDGTAILRYENELVRIAPNGQRVVLWSREPESP